MVLQAGARVKGGITGVGLPNISRVCFCQAQGFAQGGETEGSLHGLS